MTFDNSGAGNLGGYDPRNAGALAEAKAAEVARSTPPHGDVPRWPVPSARMVVLSVALLIVTAWILTLLGGR